MQVEVFVGLKNGVLDPQGAAVQHALNARGFSDVSAVRIGKWITLEIDAATADVAKARAKEICDALLVNQVIETYQLKVA